VSRLWGALHDAWCAITHRCRWDRVDTPTVRWLKQEEDAAWRSVEDLRRRRAVDPITRTIRGDQS
jgi:hypothetical protein